MAWGAPEILEVSRKPIVKRYWNSSCHETIFATCARGTAVSTLIARTTPRAILDAHTYYLVYSSLCMRKTRSRTALCSRSGCVHLWENKKKRCSKYEIYNSGGACRLGSHQWEPSPRGCVFRTRCSTCCCYWFCFGQVPKSVTPDPFEPKSGTH